MWKRTSNSFNNFGFWICSIKADKCLRTYSKLSWKYVNTAEIISKVTITLSLINSNKDFDFVGWVIKTPCLFYFRVVKFHYVKETHYINSLLKLVKIAPPSQHKRQPNKSFSREPTTRAWSSANIWRQDGVICSKNRKIVPYHGSARIPRLTVSVPDYGSWLHPTKLRYVALKCCDRLARA